MKSSLLIALIFASPLFAFAQNRVGNGGDSVVCREIASTGKIRQAVLLDLYEAELPLPATKKKHDELLKNVFEKLQSVSPEQAELYRRRGEEIPKEIKYVSGSQLADVDDSKHLIRPTEKGCKIEQAAIRKNLSLDEKRFLVSQQIWDKMDENSKAGLLLHEIVYEHLWKLGEEDSVKTRHLVSYYLSKDFQKTTKDEYWKRIQKLKLPVYR
jgi:hypothetical protein